MKWLSSVAACVFGVLGAVSCSGDPDAGFDLGTAEQRVVIVDNPSCKVELLKVDYDQPGAGSDYMELFVSQKGATANTLADCGLGALVLYLSSSCVTPYRTVLLQNVVIPADGYVAICDGAGCDVDPGPPDWMDNGAAEFGFLGVTLPQIPVLWVSYEGTAKCVPSGTTPKQKQLQAENDQSPNLVNISCSENFVLAPATSAVKRKPNPCPAPDGGTGGSGGTSGGGGTAAAGGAADGGPGGAAGAGADAGLGGAGGSAADGGLAGAGGTGADAGLAGAGGGAASGGAAGGGAAGGGGTAASGGSAATGGSAASGGSAATGGGAATGGSADAGLGLNDISVEGGGCGCRTPARAPSSSFGVWLLGAVVLLLRRRAL